MAGGREGEEGWRDGVREECSRGGVEWKEGKKMVLM